MCANLAPCPGLGFLMHYVQLPSDIADEKGKSTLLLYVYFKWRPLYLHVMHHYNTFKTTESAPNAEERVS